MASETPKAPRPTLLDSVRRLAKSRQRLTKEDSDELPVYEGPSHDRPNHALQFSLGSIYSFTNSRAPIHQLGEPPNNFVLLRKARYRHAHGSQPL